MLTVAVSYAMRPYRAEPTFDHVLVQLQSFSILCIRTRSRIDDLAILVQDAVRRDGALCFGGSQEFERVGELAVESSRKQDSVGVSTQSKLEPPLDHTSQHSASTQHPSSKRARSARRQQGD
jgi:hypothetical protein